MVGDSVQPGRNRGATDGPILIRVEDLDDFIKCPLYYAFKNVYDIKISRPKAPRVQWTDIVKDSILWFYYKIMSRHTVTWGTLLDRWEAAWAKVVREDKIDAHTARIYRDKGVRSLLTIFNGMRPRTEVLAVNYPARQRIGAFELRGTIPIIRAVRWKKRYSIHFVDIVSMPKFTPCTDLRRMLLTYGVEAKLWHDLWQTSICSVVPITYIIESNRHATIRYGDPEEIAQWAGWVLESIHQGHFYPRPGPHCARCPYTTICNTEHVATTKLLDTGTPEELAALIEERQDAADAGERPGPKYRGRQGYYTYRRGQPRHTYGFRPGDP